MNLIYFIICFLYLSLIQTQICHSSRASLERFGWTFLKCSLFFITSRHMFVLRVLYIFCMAQVPYLLNVSLSRVCILPTHIWYVVWTSTHTVRGIQSGAVVVHAKTQFMLWDEGSRCPGLISQIPLLSLSFSSIAVTPGKSKAPVWSSWVCPTRNLWGYFRCFPRIF